MPSRRLLSTVLGLVLAVGAAVPAAAPALAQEPVPSGDYQQTLDLTFPTRPDVSLADTYHACRSGCARVHKAADLMGQKMWPLYATVDGVVCRIDEGEEDGHGRHLTLCGDDDREYRYLHMNNDTPGTDDGAAGLEHVYAAGIRRGLRVARGQLLGWMGDSGNAEGTAAHLHLDVFDDRVVDPYGDTRINPYPSLVAALARGDVPDGSAFHADPASRVAGDDRIATAIALAGQVPVAGDTVVLARHDVPTDALVAGPLAGELDAPVLITRPDGLDPRVADEIRRRGAQRAVLVGNALSGDVVDDLTALGLEVERVAGDDVYGTADAVAAHLWELQGVAPAEDPVLPDGDAILPADDATVEGPTLVASTSGERTDAQVLDGATVGGRIAVWLDPDGEDVDEVVFRVDGREVNRERQEPFDLLGTHRGDARRLDTADLDPGEHRIVARVRSGGETVEVTATFTTVASGDGGGASRSAIVALGDHPDPSRQWPDALLGSWLGAVTGTPILLVTPSGVPETTQLLLEDVGDVTVIGGTGAIADDLVDDLAGRVARLGGDDRYGTAVAVAEDVADAGLAGTERVWAATGRNWPDAITAGPAIAALGEVLVLVDGDGHGMADETASWLHRAAEHLVEGIVIGGGNAVSETVMQVFQLDLT